MADIVGTSLSGLIAYQQALATTSHNISNAQTAGYSRQRVELTTRQPTFFGNGYIGNGVQASDVQRVYDSFLALGARTTASGYNQLDTYHTLAGRIDNMLADPQVGLSAGLSEFFNSVQDVANDPSSVAARQGMLSQAGQLQDRFKYLNQQLTSLSSEVNSRLSSLTDEINSLAGSVAQMNKQIVLQTGAAGGSVPNDLLDQRDQLLQQLSEKVNISTTTQQDGSVNVFVGNGQTLVLGGRSFQLGTQKSTTDISQLQVVFKSNVGNQDITSSLTGGELGGVLQFRNDMLDPAKSSLGRVAVALATTFNAQHRLGMDLDNQAGGDFFSVGGPTVLPDTGNQGNAQVSASITDVSKLTTSNYTVRYDNSQWTVTRLSDNATQVINSFPYNIDGVQLNYTGTPQNGDRFLVKPTEGLADTFGVAISDTHKIAAASPVAAQANLNNTGNGVISSGTLLDTSLYSGGTYNIVAAASASNATVMPPAGFSLSGGLDYDNTSVPVTQFSLNDDANPPVAHTVDVSFTRTANPDEWTMQTSIDSGAATASHTVRFDSSGALSLIDGVPASASGGKLTLAPFAPGGTANDMAIQVDLSGLTQLAANSTAGQSTVAASGLTDAKAQSTFAPPDPGVIYDDTVTPGTVDNALQYQLSINNVQVYTQAEGAAPITTMQDLADQINASTASTGVVAYVDNGKLLLANSTPSGKPITVNEQLVDTGGTPLDPTDTMTGYFGTTFTGDGATATASASPNGGTTTYTTAADSYVVSNAAGAAGNTVTSGSYTPGAAIVFDGLSSNITAAPNLGDSFSIGPNTAGVGDNRNALALGVLQNTGILENGNTTYDQSYGQFVADVGSKTHVADLNSQAQKTMADQAMQAKEAVSGVNLDEEAANLVRFQQAYQASAQVVSVASSLFQTLLSAVGR